MTNSAGAVQNGLVLRLSLPATGDMAAVGPELATRLARQLGVSGADAARVGAAVTDLSRTVDSSAAADVEFEFYKVGAELQIVARHDSRTAEKRIPLNA
jgi:hypothetical protein